MNRQQRRNFNRKHKTNYTKRDFEYLALYQRIRAGNLSDQDIALLKNMETAHVDNELLVPEGTPVKLHVEAIRSRPQSNFTERYKQWVEEHMDEVMHVTREQAHSSLVCLTENVEESRKNQSVPWLFDIYTDLLYYNSALGQWTPLEQLDAQNTVE